MTVYDLIMSQTSRSRILAAQRIRPGDTITVTSGPTTRGECRGCGIERKRIADLEAQLEQARAVAREWRSKAWPRPPLGKCPFPWETP